MEHLIQILDIFMKTNNSVLILTIQVIKIYLEGELILHSNPFIHKNINIMINKVEDVACYIVLC